MPKLPSRNHQRSLSKQILYKKVRSVTIINPKLRYNLNREKLNILEGKIVKKLSDVLNIFYYTLMIIFLLVHLGMTGRFILLKIKAKNLTQAFIVAQI